MHVRLPVAIAAGLVIFVLPDSAAAVTKSVTMGPPPGAQKQLEPLLSDVNAFFPSRVTVRVGDSVRFEPFGFHNVDLPKPGGKPAAFLTPTGAKANASDAAGTPFWFASLDVVGFNPALLKSAFGKRLTYDGKKALNSGLPLQDKPKPVTITFKKAGSFTYFCDVHPGMKGKVDVVGRGKRVASRSSDAKRAGAQLDAAVKVAKGLAAAKAPGDGSFRVGQAGAGGVERLAFLPEARSVARGTTVTFSMSPKSYDAHTATTGPGDPEKEPKSYLGSLAASFASPQLDPIATYPSEPPAAGPAALTPALHGNGFWNTGVMDTVAASPLPSNGRVTFAEAGTYRFFCLIHPFMKATVTVG